VTDETQQIQVRTSKSAWFLLVLVLIAAGALLWHGLRLLQESEQSAARAVSARDEAQAKLQAATGDLARLQLKVEEALTAQESSEAKIRQLEESLQQTSAELAALKATADSLQEKLKAEIARGDIKLSQSGDRIQVDLVDKILFDSGQAALTARGQEVLGRVAEVLKTIEDKQILVSGHTDNAPITNEELKKQFATNWELSVARAVNVVRYLSEVGNVPPGHLSAAGYSQYKPVANNATPKGRAANRRIEILLTPLVVAAKKQ
jgi:chemotaxis protein MotB